MNRSEFKTYLGSDATTEYLQQNAYGEVTQDGMNVICGHGGSMWLCRSCADNLIRFKNKSTETGIQRYFREQEELERKGK